jgi:hypothetical protein
MRAKWRKKRVRRLKRKRRKTRARRYVISISAPYVALFQKDGIIERGKMG